MEVRKTKACPKFTEKPGRKINQHHQYNYQHLRINSNETPVGDPTKKSSAPQADGSVDMK